MKKLLIIFLVIFIVQARAQTDLSYYLPDNIDYDPDIHDDGGGWQFQLLPLSADHVTSVAIRRKVDKNIITHLVGNDFSPLVHSGAA